MPPREPVMAQTPQPRPCPHEDSAAVLGQDKALASQHGHRLADRSSRHVEVAHQGGLTRQSSPSCKVAALYPGAQDIGDLPIDRPVAHWVDPPSHGSSYTQVQHQTRAYAPTEESP